MTLHELQYLCKKKALLVDDPNQPALGFVLVMVALNPDGSAHVASATTLDLGDTRHALVRALDMAKATEPPAAKSREHLS